MAHHEDHHYDGAHSNDAKYEEHFERGFNDGLYGESFDQSRHGQAHAEGYSAGTKERSNRLAHKNRGADHENAPDLAKRACVGEASARWGRNPRDIVVIKSKKAARDDFYVEVSAGHRHGLCEVSHDGNIYNFEKGTL